MSSRSRQAYRCCFISERFHNTSQNGTTTAGFSAYGTHTLPLHAGIIAVPGESQAGQLRLVNEERSIEQIGLVRVSSEFLLRISGVPYQAVPHRAELERDSMRRTVQAGRCQDR